MRVEAGTFELVGVVAVVVVAATMMLLLPFDAWFSAHACGAHSVIPHTSLQPIPFVFDFASLSSEESLSFSSSAKSSLPFPDLLQLGVGKVVKLGVLRQLKSGFIILLDVLHVTCDV